MKHFVIAITLGELGGTQVFSLKLAKYLKKQGYKVTVVFGDGVWLKTSCQEENIAFVHLEHFGREIRFWRDFKALYELYITLKRLKPDAIHLNSTKMGILGSLASKLCRIPRIVYCIGGWAFLEDLPTWKIHFYTFCERFTSSFKDIIINLHPADKQSALDKRITPAEKISIIPNGLNANELEKILLPKTTARQKLSTLTDKPLSEHDIIFGTIANFYPTKNLVKYVSVCAKVHKALPNSKFIFIGEGPERQHIQNVIQKFNLTDQIFLTGSLPSAAQFLPAFNFFVLPSLKEGMSITLLEAMLAKLPIIATDVGANRWMLDKNAWLVDKFNLDELAQAMLTASQTSSDILVQKTTANYNRALQDFYAEQCFKQHLQALENSN